MKIKKILMKIALIKEVKNWSKILNFKIILKIKSEGLIYKTKFSNKKQDISRIIITNYLKNTIFIYKIFDN